MKKANLKKNKEFEFKMEIMANVNNYFKWKKVININPKY